MYYDVRQELVLWRLLLKFHYVVRRRRRRKTRPSASRGEFPKLFQNEAKSHYNCNAQFTTAGWSRVLVAQLACMWFSERGRKSSSGGVAADRPLRSRARPLGILTPFSEFADRDAPLSSTHMSHCAFSRVNCSTQRRVSSR